MIVKWVLIDLQEMRKKLKNFSTFMLWTLKNENISVYYVNVCVTSGQWPRVWLGVITTLVVTKNAPFSAGGTWTGNVIRIKLNVCLGISILPRSQPRPRPSRTTSSGWATSSTWPRCPAGRLSILSPELLSFVRFLDFLSNHQVAQWHNRYVWGW